MIAALMRSHLVASTAVHDLTRFGLTSWSSPARSRRRSLTSKLSARTSVPSAALFLVAAAVASDIFPSLELSIRTVERVATVALIVILFDGGTSIGLRRFRVAAVPIVSLGDPRHVRDRGARRAVRALRARSRLDHRPACSAPRSRRPIRR